MQESVSEDPAEPAGPDGSPCLHVSQTGFSSPNTDAARHSAEAGCPQLTALLSASPAGNLLAPSLPCSPDPTLPLRAGSSFRARVPGAVLSVRIKHLHSHPPAVTGSEPVAWGCLADSTPNLHRPAWV